MASWCTALGSAWRSAGGKRGDCDTAYDIMSMTKQFTAAGILKLQMMGRLRVDDPLGVFSVPADKRAITVRDLLTHTSGLDESLGGDYQPLSRDEMVQRALNSTGSPTGRKYLYSNVGYSLLAAIIEEVSGRRTRSSWHRTSSRPPG